MEIQTTKFIKGGLSSLENEIQVQRENGMCLTSFIVDDGDFFAVFRDRSVQLNMDTSKFFTVPSSLHELNAKITELAENGNFVSTLTVDDPDIIIMVSQALIPASHGHEFDNYLTNYGID